MKIQIDRTLYFEIVGRPGKPSTISSNLKLEDVDDQEDQAWNNHIDMLESMILAHHVAGIDVTSEAYLAGIRTAVEVASNVISEMV